MQQEAQKYSTLSLVSTTLTGGLTSVHHIYQLGHVALILAFITIVLPLLSMQWFSRTGNKVALWAYRLLTAWLVIGFGLADGLWNHVIRTLGFYYVLLPAHGGDTKVVERTFSILPPEVGNFLFEGTGVLTFVVSMFAAYYGLKSMRAMKQLETTQFQNNLRGQHV